MSQSEYWRTWHWRARINLAFLVLNLPASDVKCQQVANKVARILRLQTSLPLLHGRPLVLPYTFEKRGDGLWELGTTHGWHELENVDYSVLEVLDA